MVYIPTAVAIGLKILNDSNKRVNKKVIFQEGYYVAQQFFKMFLLLFK